MLSAEYQRKRLIVLGCVFCLSCIVASALFIQKNSKEELNHFRAHAGVIAEDVWAMDPTGALSYLQLVQKTDYYRELYVSISGEEDFLQLSLSEPTGISQFLYNIGLIREKTFKETILFQGHAIGSLQGTKYIRIIFPLLNIFIIHLLFYFISINIDASLQRRRMLEREVLEKTQNWKDSDRRFHDLVDLLPEMVLETDLDGGIEYANKQAKKRFVSSENYTQASFLDFVSEGDRHRARKIFDQAMLGQDAGLVELSVSDSKGCVFPVLIRSAPVKQGDNIVGVRTVVIDITERQRMEEQLRKDQKMKTIGLMAGGVAHDLNNILSGIVSYPELILMGVEKDSSMVEPLKAIHKAGLDAREVVADLLTVARGVVVEAVVEQPNRLVKEYLNSPDFYQLSIRYPLVTFETDLNPNVRNISCAPIHVRKCLMNLITNGAEAITNDGKILISTDNYRDANEGSGEGNKPGAGHYTRITVQDSGPGIDPDELENIFEPFFTKKVMGRSGTGLGLAVVRNTMRDHGGTVTVSSSANGTVFNLFFPCVDTESPRTLDDSNWKIFRGDGQSVLVVDDEQAPRDLAIRLLSQLGYVPEAVHSGEEALQYLSRKKVDIVVLDMVMKPGFLNGRQTYEEVLKIHPGQAAVIASGYAEDQDVNATLEMGANAFVAKPYSVVQIGSALHEALTG